MPGAALPLLAGGALVGGIASSALGGKMKQGAPQGYTSQESGFRTMPKELQDAYIKQYLPQLLAQYEGKYQAGPMGQAETGPLAPLGLQELQRHYNQYGSPFGGNNGAKPLGIVEPFNPYQISALQQFGETNGQNLGAAIQPYQELYNKNVLDPELERIKEDQAVAENQLVGQGAGNLGFFGSSALGTLAGQLKNNYSNLRRDTQAQGFESALGLRRQTLAEMLQAGNAIQEQGQSYLDALNPHLQASLPQNRLQNFGAGLNAIPGASSIGTQYFQPAPQPNAAMRWGGALQSLGSLGLMANNGGFGGGMGGYTNAPQMGNYGGPPRQIYQPPAGFGGAQAFGGQFSRTY
jgi:hypothetical protein